MVWAKMLKALFAAIAVVGRWLNSERLKQAGRDSAAVEAQDRTLDRVRKANEIDARPTHTDKSVILDGLRKHDSGG